MILSSEIVQLHNKGISGTYLYLFLWNSMHNWLVEKWNKWQQMGFSIYDWAINYPLCTSDCFVYVISLLLRASLSP